MFTHSFFEWGSVSVMAKIKYEETEISKEIAKLKKLVREEIEHLHEEMKVMEDLKIVNLTVEELEKKLAEVTGLIGEVSYSNFKVFRDKMHARLGEKSYIMKAITDIFDSFGMETYTMLTSLRVISDNIRFLAGRT